MRTVKYVGSDPRYAGKTALMLPYPTEKQDSCKVQLDDIDFDEAFGWHVFPIKDWQEISP